jgi:hypothetical protein
MSSSNNSYVLSTNGPWRRTTPSHSKRPSFRSLRNLPIVLTVTRETMCMFLGRRDGAFLPKRKNHSLRLQNDARIRHISTNGKREASRYGLPYTQPTQLHEPHPDIFTLPLTCHDRTLSSGSGSSTSRRRIRSRRRLNLDASLDQSH